MLSKKNLLLIVATIFCLSSAIVAQSFSWSGPTNLNINYGQTTASASYYFTYNNLSGLCYPGLIIAVNGNVINNDLCHNPSTPSSYTINFTEGTHTVQFSLLSINCNTLNCFHAIIHKVYVFTVTVNFKIRHENIFTYGTIYVDNYTTPRNSPYDRTSNPNNSYSIGAIDQSYGGYNWSWNNSGINNSKWIRRTSDGSEYNYSYDRNTNYTVQPNDKNTKLIAGLRKICNITFRNSFVGISNGGKIQVNGITYDLPTSAFNVVELNPIVASAVDRQTFNNIIYHFSKWSDGNTSFNRTFYPSANATYTAQFIGKPSIANRNLHTGQVYNQPIVLYWNEHPNSYVTKYQIWRQVKHNGILGSPQLLTTVNRGTLSYVDYDYVLTNGYTADLIFYDVRPFYSLEGTYSDPSWMPVYGDGSVVPKSSDSTQVNKEELDYSISNYPNPFNPVTNIQIWIKKAGYVNVSVYDLLGQKVAELMNEEKEAGSYTLLFDGSELPSGTYIYTMRVGNYSESRKMILMK